MSYLYHFSGNCFRLHYASICQSSVLYVAETTILDAIALIQMWCAMYSSLRFKAIYRRDKLIWFPNFASIWKKFRDLNIHMLLVVTLPCVIYQTSFGLTYIFIHANFIAFFFSVHNVSMSISRSKPSFGSQYSYCGLIKSFNIIEMLYFCLQNWTW